MFSIINNPAVILMLVFVYQHYNVGYNSMQSAEICYCSKASWSFRAKIIFIPTQLSVYTRLRPYHARSGNGKTRYHSPQSNTVHPSIHQSVNHNKATRSC